MSTSITKFAENIRYVVILIWQQSHFCCFKKICNYSSIKSKSLLCVSGMVITE